MKNTVKLTTGQLQYANIHFPLLAMLKMPMWLKMTIREASEAFAKKWKQVEEEMTLNKPEEIKKLEEKLNGSERLSDKKKEEIQAEVTKLETEWEKTDDFKERFVDPVYKFEIETISTDDLRRTNLYMRDCGVGTIIKPQTKFTDNKQATAAEQSEEWLNSMSNQLENALYFVVK